MIFDDSGMLVNPKSLTEFWKKEVNHTETCSKCGYTWISRARYSIRHICPHCGEGI